MKYGLTMAFAMLTILTLWPVTDSIAQNNGDIKLRVDDLVRKHYMEGVPYAVAHDLGPAALPYLFDLLGKNEEKQFWVNIVVTIGFIENDSAVDSLIAFLEQTAEEVDSFTFRAKLSVPYALGCIASGGNPKALRFLADKTNTPKGQAIGWSYKNKPIADLIAERSIMGLAVSGRSEARQILEELKTSESRETDVKSRTATSAHINQGIRIMDQIKTRGRVAILNPQH